MTSPAVAPRHFCGFSQTVAHKNFIVELKKLLKEEGREKMKTGAMFKYVQKVCYTVAFYCWRGLKPV